MHLHEPSDDVLPFSLFIHQATSHGIPSDAEVLLTLHLAPNRITYPIGVVSYRVEIVSGFLDGQRPRAFGRRLFLRAP